MISAHLQLWRRPRQRLAHNRHPIICEAGVVEVEGLQLGLVGQACRQGRRHLSSHGVVTEVEAHQAVTW